MSRFLIAITALLALSSCKKETASTTNTEPDGSTSKYHFTYKAGTKTGGYGYARCAMDVFPSSEWKMMQGGGGTEIVSGTYPNIAYSNSYMADNGLTGITVMYTNGSIAGKPDNFMASIEFDRFDPGTYTSSNGLKTVSIVEISGPVGFTYSSNVDSEESMTVTISKVGAIGELITGSFSGKVHNYESNLQEVSGTFSVVRDN